jgi:hypothetical protein
MAFLNDLERLLSRLGEVPCLDVEAEGLVAAVESLSDDDLVAVLERSAALRTSVERLSIIAAGVAARRSHRDRGYRGLAGTRGHRTPVAMIQSLTGGTAADARKAVQAGESLLPTPVMPAAQPTPGTEQLADAAESTSDDATPEPWHASLGTALLRGRITLDQHEAIRGGLGEPPTGDAESAAEAVHVWSIAASQLLAEASGISVEELRARSRAVRDVLDPAGAEQRFADRYQARSFRMWTDRAGQHHGHLVFDDDAAAWVQSMIDAALRPRRGGPRFVDSEAKVQADELASDGRSNEQLAYDLVFDVLRAGSLANAEDVFGARQPGVRLVVVSDGSSQRDLYDRLLATGYTEDRGVAVPGSLIDRAVCETGTVAAYVDTDGNPLELGREQRLFSRAQRVMLAIRDGGCRWPGCDRAASYTEAHHSDHWAADHGRTDIDRGILLCRHHHMLLHNNGWKITRRGREAFVLHGPPGSGIPSQELPAKAPWSWAWRFPPPPERQTWRATGSQRSSGPSEQARAAVTSVRRSA